MTKRTFAVGLGTVVFTVFAAMPSSAVAADPLTGKWNGELRLADESAPRPVTMDLKLQAKGAVTGTFSGLRQPGDVKTGFFDSKTGRLKLEVGKTSDAAVLVVFEGTVARGKITGHLTGQMTGEFALTKTGAK